MDFIKVFKWSVVIIFLVILAILYKTYNPDGNNYFPKCPFKVLTGFECPGCGSQRAIHHLLNFEVLGAFKENPLLVLSIPYLLVGITFDLIKHPGNKALKWRKILYGEKAIYILLAIIIAFWILRNII